MAFRVEGFRDRFASWLSAPLSASEHVVGVLSSSLSGPCVFFFVAFLDAWALFL